MSLNPIRRRYLSRIVKDVAERHDLLPRHETSKGGPICLKCGTPVAEWHDGPCPQSMPYPFWN